MVSTDMQKGAAAVRAGADIVDFRELFAQLWAKKIAIILFTMLVGGLAVLLAFSLPSVYRGTSTVLIEVKEAEVVSITKVYDIEDRGFTYLYTQFEILSSQKLLRKVVSKLELTTHKDFDPRQKEPGLIDLAEIRGLLGLSSPSDIGSGPSEEEIRDDVVRKLAKAVSIEPILGTSLAKIHVEMKDPQLAADAANALAESYLESQLEARLSITDSANSWMRGRLEELRVNLRASEKSLQDYRDQQQLIDLGGVTTASAAELDDSVERLSDASRRRVAAESLYEEIQELRERGGNAAESVPAILANPLIQNLKIQEDVARTKVQELSRRYGPKHPKMIAARSELRSIQGNLNQRVSQVMASIEKDYQLALADEQALKAILEDNKGAIQVINRKRFKLRELEREVEMNRSLYEVFITRLKETSATSGLDSATASIVEEAVVPKTPVKPNKKIIVLVAIVGAFMSSVLLVLLRYLLSNTFKQADELESQFEMPVIGEVPAAKAAKGVAMSRLYGQDTAHLFSESIRSIRTGVMLTKASPKVILVTSSMPQEGKSTLSANLAASFAQLGRVLLVDADMRRPSVAKNFGIESGHVGIADMLAAQADDYSDYICRDGDIDVLVAGGNTGKPQELIASDQFHKMIERLAEDYDHVVIDSPPVLAVSDARLISRISDVVLYVVKAESTTSNKVLAGLQKIEHSGDAATRLVLNQASEGASYQNYYYYQG